MSRAEPEAPRADAAPEDAPKRRQILDGAQKAFLAKGFEATSMGEIARVAGVSKGTLYVYFDSKEGLFRDLVVDLKRAAAERITSLRRETADVESVLTDFGQRLAREMTRPDHVQLLRMVLAVSDRFPDVGKAFFRAGPCHGAERLSAWLTAQTEAGRLKVERPQEAAWQFLGMVNQPGAMAALMGEPDVETEEERDARIARAAAAFVRAHRG